MSESLPAPLTPPDCDLRKFRDMPFDIGRFRDSNLVTHAEPEEIIAALLLWGVAWHQVPAASLPDDDRLLARYAGYGKVVDAWLKVKAGALRGFVLCDDGRLYHRTLAQKALESWDRMQRHEYEKARDRHRKAERDLPADQKTEFPDFEPWKLARAYGSNDRASTAESAPKRQESLPLEFAAPSGGTTVRARPPARTAGPRAPARTGARSVPDGNSGGNDDQFQRNDPAIPTENALKGKEGKGMESTHPIPSQSPEPARSTELGRVGSGVPPSDQEREPPGDPAAQLLVRVLEVAGLTLTTDEAKERELKRMRRWLKAGIDFEAVVYPTIQSWIAKTHEPTRTLGRFEREVQHEHARRAAHKANGSTYKPPPAPILEPPGEDPQFHDLRVELLAALGPDCYSLMCNEVTFEAIPDMPSGRLPLRVVPRDPDRHHNRITDGGNGTIIRRLARQHGFNEVWG